ncbi:hypothetical protein CEUSTIGMA_g3742.t1 [Chlamydomonas eustigma]|uniref:Myb-like domain-containing protein n=1 Tax=Chlamydomonas eustigma TaxID=1157962 RepID=A0A250WZN2_9CHLO|nr:hypothetical protein CEUSTIGMA_g3742.t1 [Chlamydomonas eustigma]|eukprot:GAX76297.1 hypothetical protein CEUSTIGMA_g3742.t1 [Chlamydomonas eustigma]
MMDYLLVAPQNETVGYWTSDEMTLLAAAVKAVDNGELPGSYYWEKVASLVPRRTAKQCRTKWLNEMREGICKGPWSLREEYILILVHSAVGNKWSKISKYLNGRPENTVKNHWSATSRSKNATRTRTLLWQYINLIVNEQLDCSKETFTLACERYNSISGVVPLAEFVVDLNHFVSGPGKGLAGLASGISAPMGRPTQEEEWAAGKALKAKHEVMGKANRSSSQTYDSPNRNHESANLMSQASEGFCIPHSQSLGRMEQPMLFMGNGDYQLNPNRVSQSLQMNFNVLDCHQMMGGMPLIPGAHSAFNVGGHILSCSNPSDIGLQIHHQTAPAADYEKYLAMAGMMPGMDGYEGSMMPGMDGYEGSMMPGMDGYEGVESSQCPEKAGEVSHAHHRGRQHAPADKEHVPEAKNNLQQVAGEHAASKPHPSHGNLHPEEAMNVDGHDWTSQGGEGQQQKLGSFIEVIKCEESLHQAPSVAVAAAASPDSSACHVDQHCYDSNPSAQHLGGNLKEDHLLRAHSTFSLRVRQSGAAEKLPLWIPDSHGQECLSLSNLNAEDVSPADVAVVITFGKLATDQTLNAEERLSMIQAYKDAIQCVKRARLE